MKRVVIIGGGHAAAEAVGALRQAGWQDEIVMISAEERIPYQRPPLSKGYLNGKVTADALAIKKPVFYDKTQTRLRLGSRVTRIDPARSIVELDTGETLAYSYLIYATGTRPRQLTLDGAAQASLHYLRTVEDVETIRPQLTPGQRLLLVGAGYIGLEIAASARQLGLEVDILDVQDRVLARVTSPPVSQFFEQYHSAAGVRIHPNTGITHFSRVDDQPVAHLNHGGQITYDLAVVGIGVLPNEELAAEAGLACEDGVLVNPRLQTSVPTIYAIGDCARHANHYAWGDELIRVESVQNAADQAKVAARNICGTATDYQALPWFWSDQYDIKFQSAGLATGHTGLEVIGDPEQRSFCVLYFRDERLICVDAINHPKAFMTAKKVIPDASRNQQADAPALFAAL